MTSTQHPQTDGVLKRAMCLFDLYTLLNNGMYIIGFYFLPEGFMRRSPQVAVGGLVAEAGSFWSELGLTIFFNLVLMSGLVIVLNLNRVKGFPVGYLMPISWGSLRD